MSAIGLRSKDTPRKRLGTPVPIPRLAARAIFAWRHSHGAAVLSSSSIQPDPSHTPTGQRGCSPGIAARNGAQRAHPMPAGTRPASWSRALVRNAG